MPLINTVDIYRYSDELLKHMLKDVFETIENDLLYSKKKVVIYGNNNDRRAYHTKTGGNRTDENLTERIQKLQNQLKNEHVYRIPLKYLCDIGLVNQIQPDSFQIQYKVYSNSTNRHSKIV